MKTIEHMAGTEGDALTQALNGLDAEIDAFIADRGRLILENKANLARIAELESLLRRVDAAMSDPDGDNPFGLDMLQSDIQDILKGTK